jgi:hypothetical protein
MKLEDTHMPIKGLTERTRLPRLGKIHLGIQVPVMKEGKPKLYESGPNKGQPIMRPKATDYFVFTEDVREEMEAIYGPEPKELNILIATDDPEEWASQWYRCYSRSRGLVCRGDGETCHRMIDTKTGALAGHESGDVEWKDMPCAGKECPDYINKRTGCRESMNLQFMLPDAPGLGVWQIDTNSINSILNINANAKLITDIALILGRTIAWIPIKLTFEPKTVVNPEDLKKKTVHVLNMRVAVKLQEVINVIAGPVGGLLLPAPSEDGPADDAELLELPDPDEEIPEAALARQDHAEEEDAETTAADVIVEAEKVVEEAPKKAAPVPQSQKATVDPALAQAAKDQPNAVALPAGIPQPGAMGVSTNAELAVLEKLAGDNGYTMDELLAYAQSKATGGIELNWHKMTKQQIRKLAILTVRKEIEHVNQGPESEPESEPESAAVGGDTGEPGDDDGWNDLINEADNHRGGAGS